MARGSESSEKIRRQRTMLDLRGARAFELLDARSGVIELEIGLSIIPNHVCYDREPCTDEIYGCARVSRLREVMALWRREGSCEEKVLRSYRTIVLILCALIFPVRARSRLRSRHPQRQSDRSGIAIRSIPQSRHLKRHDQSNQYQ
jgi:hypothetical protein